MRHQIAAHLARSLSMYHTSADSQPIKKGRVGRNDKCPCGSGKKAKHCCPERTRP